jgi:hypothetical protein
MREAMSVACGMILLACAGSGGHAPPGSATTPALSTPPSAPRTQDRVAHTPPPALPLDPDERAIVELRRASELFATFVAKAGDNPEFVDAVRRSKERMADIRATLPFLEAGLRERKGR